MVADHGLVVFVVVVLLNVLGLLVDLALDRSGKDTITQWVWELPLLGVPLLALQLVGFLALLAHLYPKR